MLSTSHCTCEKSRSSARSRGWGYRPVGNTPTIPPQRSRLQANTYGRIRLQADRRGSTSAIKIRDLGRKSGRIRTQANPCGHYFLVAEEEHIVNIYPLVSARLFQRTSRKYPHRYPQKLSFAPSRCNIAIGGISARRMPSLLRLKQQRPRGLQPDCLLEITQRNRPTADRQKAIRADRTILVLREIDVVWGTDWREV